MPLFNPSESIEEVELEQTFEYLENGAPVTITRARAFELRTEGLAVFNDDFLSLAQDIHGPSIPEEAVKIYHWAYTALQAVSLYFWVIPSTSSGKFHPAFSQGEQGLVKHTLAGMYYTAEFTKTLGLNAKDAACAVAASAIHDTCKYGLDYNPRYYAVHECLVRIKLGQKETRLDGDLPRETYEKIIRAVETHNGNLKEGSWTAFRMPPQDDIARAVHLGDYTVSRKKFSYDI